MISKTMQITIMQNCTVKCLDIPGAESLINTLYKLAFSRIIPIVNERKIIKRNNIQIQKRAELTCANTVLSLKPRK